MIDINLLVDELKDILFLANFKTQKNLKLKKTKENKFSQENLFFFIFLNVGSP